MLARPNGLKVPRFWGVTLPVDIGLCTGRSKMIRSMEQTAEHLKPMESAIQSQRDTLDSIGTSL